MLAVVTLEVAEVEEEEEIVNGAKEMGMMDIVESGQRHHEGHT